MIYTAWKWPLREMAIDLTWRIEEAISTSSTKPFSLHLACISYFSTLDRLPRTLRHAHVSILLGFRP
jgi:hypothetical protein